MTLRFALVDKLGLDAGYLLTSSWAKLGLEFLNMGFKSGMFKNSITPCFRLNKPIEGIRKRLKSS